MEKETITLEELTALYNDMLDEDSVIVGGIAFSGSRILEELDPIAYNCGLNDFYDMMSDEYYCEDME